VSFKKTFRNLPLIEYLFQRKLRGKTIVLLVMVLTIVCGSAVIGCVRGLQPIGWSGGVVDGGSLFVGSKEGRLVSVNLTTGSRQWSEALKMPPSRSFSCASPMYGGSGCGSTPTGVAIYGTPAVAGDLVYIGGYNGRIYAFNSSSLQVRWVYPREEYLKAIISGPVVVADKICFCTSDGDVYALDAATGDKKWEFEINDKVWATLVSDDDTIYVGSFDDKLYALDVESGKKKWEFEAQGAIASNPLVYDDTLYVGSLDKNLYAVDTANGQQKWEFTGGRWFWATPVAYNGVLYAPCLDGKVYLLDAGSGREVADAIDLGGPVSSSPIMIGGKVIIVSQSGIVYTLNTSNNAIAQIADIERNVYGPLCASNGVIYIHTQDLTIHPVDTTTGGALAVISLKSSE
jgi:outer membrane protein assembly factor BamB